MLCLLRELFLNLPKHMLLSKWSLWILEQHVLVTLVSSHGQMLWVNRIFHLLYGMVSNLRGKSFFFGMCYAVLGEVEILLIYVI